MQKQLQDFFDNTKQLHLFLSLALFFTLIVMFIPPKFKLGKMLSQSLVILFLSYILYCTLTETHRFSKLQDASINSEDASINSEDVSNDLKNNMIASYVLCAFIFLLIAYLFYSTIIL